MLAQPPAPDRSTLGPLSQLGVLPWLGLLVATAPFCVVWSLADDLAAAGVAVVCLGLGSASALRMVGLRADATEGVLARLALAAHVALGMGAGLYEAAWPYDTLVHVLVPALIAARIGGRLHARIGAAAPDLVAPLAVAAAVAIGAGWELFEFAVDATGLFALPAQKGLGDTMGDLAADVAGAVIGVVWVSPRAARAGARPLGATRSRGSA